MFQTQVIDINVTGACNLACGYCYGEPSTKPDMEKETFLQAACLAQFTGASVIELCGGEPLLYRDFEWAVYEARARDFGLILRTNGYFIYRRRAFIAANFEALGISLDGDAQINGLMRPLKGKLAISTEEKLSIPLDEFAHIKAIKPDLQVILASVATRINVDGLLRLAELLLLRKIPLDLWKVYQFVPNNFRAKKNRDYFSLKDEPFSALESRLKSIIGDRFKLICRKNHDIDGSCLIVTRDGDVLLGAHRVGNVLRNSFQAICEKLGHTDAEAAIATNKTMTYCKLLAVEAK